MTDKQINFGHNYHKLQKDEFTTIRGKGWFKKYSIGEIVSAKTPSGVLQLQVKDLQLHRIIDLPLVLLQLDAEYPNFHIKSHDDFVNLINSLRAYYMVRANLYSEVTVLYLRKVTANLPQL